MRSRSYGFRAVPRSGRFLVECLRLLVGTGDHNVEPYFCTMALYNVATQAKVSEDFSFHLNQARELGMVASHHRGVDEATRATRALFKVATRAAGPSLSEGEVLTCRAHLVMF